MLSKHLEWAQSHPDRSEAKHFLGLAQLYTSHQDHPTYGLLMASAADVERAMRECEAHREGEDG